ncbi:uncharacterized protein BKA55DRAFT_79864 [Fusarium redolens]|uniref:Secreted protein n=1 Tax=Fusarium redolens TaxID=48865 RepID=A0A9P9GRP1_FUSRE|nr:uncharacterized protein BKA55DRAFT_79864 [Fusarium redolens]KAH7244240.1 hypothetical protein BKA55DRAFT_79864 [Fusarium redolens]
MILIKRLLIPFILHSLFTGSRTSRRKCHISAAHTAKLEKFSSSCTSITNSETPLPCHASYQVGLHNPRYSPDPGSFGGFSRSALCACSGLESKTP